ncbi:hypothetical protein Cgig2_007014 [Carnegiea gigantea]|uniref:RRM domain-containing protein n=1 Tax=Carnegiea gigantea TaxID=171969 RepID=A0A9Q1QET5_9CARY|nr:hypothetical protein Cgig2_007014 [Carnegiea gigantea]
MDGPFMLQLDQEAPKKRDSAQFSGRNGFRLFARKEQQGSKLGGIELEKEADFVEDEGFEFDDEFDFDDDEVVDDDEEDADEMLPLDKMDARMKNRPKGFGVAKVYDTSIEDKLMEEIEQSRRAQLANINKLKNKSIEAKPTKDLKELKASEIVSGEIRVRINNLPKKMNVHRDLRSAFQGVHGIVNISPAVLGNKKTRDPVCKGFGFVDFKSVEDANRFVQMFSGQNVVFGKIQKRIKCEILESYNDSDKGLRQYVHRSTSEPRTAASEDEVDDDLTTEETEPLMQYLEDEDFDEDFDGGDAIDDIELLRASKEGDHDGMESEFESGRDSSSLKQKKKAKVEKTKSGTDRKPDKIPQLSIPGSAMRLKLRQRADLSEVFSRYGVDFKEALASKEISVASKDKGDQDSGIEEKDPSLQFGKDNDFDECFDGGDDIDDFELLRASKQGDDDGTESELEGEPESSSLKQKNKANGEKKRSGTDRKPDKIPQLSIPSSAIRLKLRERADLSELFSRYGVDFKEALALKEISVASEGIGDQDSDIDEKGSSLQFGEENDYSRYDEELDDEDDVENIESVEASEQEGNNRTESDTKATLPSVLSVHNEKTTGEVKKSEDEEKPNKIPAISVQELGELLRIRDPATLKELVSRLRAVQGRGDVDANVKDLLQFLGERAPKDFDKDVPDFSSLRRLKNGDNNVTKLRTAMAASNSSSSAKQEEKKTRAARKTSSVKKKGTKPSKLKVPGSAQRLKSRDKAKLTDVFSKYGGKGALSSKEKLDVL